MKNISALFVLILALVLCGCKGAKELELTNPRKADIQESFSEPAKTRLVKTWRITMPIGGRIRRIELEPGDKISKGQKIVDFDLVPFEQSLTEASAAVKELESQVTINEYNKLEKTALKETHAAIDATKEALKAADAQIDAEKARSDRATKELDRQEQLIKTNAISQSQLEDYILQAETALIELKKQEFVKAAMNAIFIAYQLGPQFINEWLGRKTLEREVLLHQLTQAKARLARAEHELALTDVTSPINGVVLERFDLGDTVLSPGQPLLLLGDLTQLEVVAEVLTQDALRIEPGSKVILKPAAQMNSLSGKVKRIEPAGFTKLSSLGVEQQRVNVIISLDEIPENLGVGYRLQARFITKTRKNTLIVPRFSVLQDQNGSFYVFKLKGDRLIKQTVEIGLRSDLELEIIKGITQQDTIVATPDTTMNQGDKVKTKS